MMLLRAVLGTLAALHTAAVSAQDGDRPVLAHPHGAPARTSAGVGDSATISLHPVLGRPMILTVTDQRRTSSGSVVTFSITHRLVFTQEAPSHWSVEWIQEGVDCAPAGRACDAYRALLSPRNQENSHFAVTAEAMIDHDNPAVELRSTTASAVGANAPLVVAVTEAQRPGTVASADLAEALYYIGRTLSAGVTTTAGQQTVVVHNIGPQIIDLEETLLVHGVGTIDVERKSMVRIDRDTGLVIFRRTETRGAPGDANQPLSVRQWQLTPMAGAPQ